MPDLNNNNFGIGQLDGKLPIASYASSSYQINGGSAIAAGASVTETITATGILTTDLDVAIRARDAVFSAIPKGLQLVSTVVSATNTVTVVWRNSLAVAIPAGAIPAAGVWTVSALGQFSK